MSNQSKYIRVSPQQVNAFRLRRHGLIERGAGAVADVCKDLSGVQSQILASAQLAIWSRMRNPDRSDLASALYRDRTVVRTLVMRQTLHVIPSAEFATYISALKRSSSREFMRVMSIFGITVEDRDFLNRTIVEELADGALSKGELRERVKRRMPKPIQEWMGKIWNPLKTAISEGLICYGEDRGSEVTFVRTDRWLRKQKQPGEAAAKKILFERYLSSYGPATIQDFSRWSGITMQEIKESIEPGESGVADVYVNSKLLMILARDLEELMASTAVPTVRLLPGFDPYLLAHVEKDHLVSPKYYKKVYRSQGWISPVVLVNGKIAGIWSYKRSPKLFSIDVEMFDKLTPRVRSRIGEEIARLGEFCGVKSEVSYS